jgi:hypothetical protein
MVELGDGDGKPIANQKFVVKMNDGSKKEGKTGTDGTGSIENLDAGEYEVTFPDLAESA